ncbi:hypothetical protein [Haladaptatus sp. DYSN1]|uniref:hypothetical protein n=1 Tax=unclassified Haladaptatus TaxID=2622732 RepID=UPI00240694BE|nr:hypothetical protein [Haladaptatus sp. DYSN1]
MIEKLDRRRLVILFTLVVVLLSTLVLAQPTTVQDAAPPAELRQTPEGVHLVEGAPNSSAMLWPYTSRSHSFSQRTLPINMIVHGNASRVRYILMEQTDAKWNVTRDEWVPAQPEEQLEGQRGPRIDWGSTRGADRFVYIHNPVSRTGQVGVDPETEGGGLWVPETYQVHDGTYLGTRTHIRLYAGGSGDSAWTAMQIHHEHWDWFRLRHTVGSLEKGRTEVERDLIGAPFVTDVTREYHGTRRTIDADGWTTIIDLDSRNATATGLSVAPLLGLLFVPALTRRLDDVAMQVRKRTRHWPLPPRSVLLFGSMVGLMLFVRIGAVTVESWNVTESPKLIAGFFYPFLAAGIPLAAYKLAQGLERDDAFLLAMFGLGFGILADYAYLDIEVIPVNVMLHRIVLAVAIGVLAAGGARYGAGESRLNRHLVGGLVLWICSLVWPLLGWV